MNDYCNHQQSRIPYMGGEPVRCPRCSNVVTNRFCPFCGLDLSTIYSRAMTESEKSEQNCAHSQYANSQQFNQAFNQPQYNNQPPFMYGYPQPQRKNNKAVVISVVILSAILCIYLLVRLVTGTIDVLSGQKQKDSINDDIMSPYTQEEFFSPGGVSAQEFEKLKKGMSYAQVSAIIGGDGELVNQGKNLHNEDFYTYGWTGEKNQNARIYITITNDIVTDITSEGEIK